METKTKVILGISAGIIIIAVAAVVYFKVIKPKKMEDEAKKAADAAANQMKGQAPEEVAAAAAAAASQTVLDNGGSPEQAKEVAKSTAASKMSSLMATAGVGAAAAATKAKEAAAKAEVAVKATVNKIEQHGGLINSAKIVASDAVTSIKDFIFGKTPKPMTPKRAMAKLNNVYVYGTDYKPAYKKNKYDFMGTNLKDFGNGWVEAENSKGQRVFIKKDEITQY